MRTTILKRAWRAVGQAHFVPQSQGAIVMVALLLAATNLFATATVVNWVSGGPNPGESGVSPLGAGYVDGDITIEAAYNTPCGIAADLSGNYLFVADYTNNAIRLLEFDINDTSTLLTLNGLNLVTNLFHHPIGVAIDSSYNLFVLNRGNGNNGNVLEFAIDEDLFATLVATNAANLTNAAGIALDFSDNIYVTIKSNKVLKITSPGVSNVVATVTNAGASLQGIVVKYNGLLAVCDSGRNGIYFINPTNGVVTTNAGFNGAGDFINTVNNRDPISIARFFQPTGVAETGVGSLIVTDFGNHRVKVVTSTSVTNLYGVTSSDWVYNSTNLLYFWPGFVDGTVVVPDKPGGVAARQPFGVTIAPDGSVYVTEDYYHIIRHVTGAGLKPPLYPPLAPADLTATAGYGQVILTWTASASPGVTNYNIKRSTSSGGPYTNNIVGSTAATNYTDTNVADGTTYYYVVSAVSSTVGEGPNSLEANAAPMFSPVPGNLTVTNFNFGPVILTWSTSAGATSYNVKRSTSTNGPFTTIGSPTSTSYTDTSALVGTMYYYVVSAVNGGGESANSLEVPYNPPFPPPPPPRIGWFDYEPDPIYPIYLITVLHPFSTYIANNDLNLAIDPTTNGVATFYITTNGPQPVLAVPSATNGTTPQVTYQEGVRNYIPPLPVTTEPDLVIKAVNVDSGGSSAVVTAEILFQVGNPTIIGDNAAQFTVSDITTNVTLWYTIDGTNPTNAPPSIGPILLTNGNPVTLSLAVSSNLLFQARAFRNGYQPSGLGVQFFSTANFVPNSISFGFASGEASSDFIASPGQTFFAPVTLSVLPNTQIYSLQFNMTVNSGGPNPGPAVTPGAFGFQSLLEKPIPGVSPVVYEHIPPLMFAAYATNPPPPSVITYLDGLPFVNLETTNLGLNLLAVGWLERFGNTNLYNTLSQDLITYSQAHDTMYPSAQYPGQIEVGGYSFLVPTNAAPDQTYQIQIGRPSATSDGIGAPGSAMFIYAPTNGSFTNGAINAIKNVTIGQRKYIVGDVYPFRWFNAGDFGSGNLVTYGNADVEQVFEAATYELDSPAWQAPGSDFFDAMDSCGGTYVDLGHGYLEFNTLVSGAGALNPLFDGNDTTIDQIAFGDGQLDVCDVYVTFIRSEFSNHVCFQRFWTNGVRVAQIVPNPDIVSSAVSKSASVVSKIAQQAGNTSITNQPKVNFVAGDCQTNTGSTIQIPITASVFGNYPLRVLMLNLTVVPLDGSPALTTPVTFSYNPALGSPWTTDQKGNGNYSAVWLNSGISGLTGNVSIGTLTVTIPANATSSSAYAIHFDHASASPNGIASFPKQARTGLITLSNRSGSSWGDGIPDSWRLRYFLTLNNLLSQTNADADGDGMNNLQEYLAGTDPTDPTSFFKNLGTDPSAAQQPSDCVISWSSVSGKQYVIERSPSLSTPIWIPVSTNSGNGTIMEYHDSSGGGIRFYRVQVQ